MAEDLKDYEGLKVTCTECGREDTLTLTSTKQLYSVKALTKLEISNGWKEDKGQLKCPGCWAKKGITKSA